MAGLASAKNFARVAFLSIVVATAGCGSDAHVDGTINGGDSGAASSGALTCAVTFGMTSSETVSAMDFEIDYSRAEGEFVGANEQVSCTRLLSGAYTYVADRCGQESCPSAKDRKVSVSIAVTGTTTGPRHLLRCDFVADVPPTSTDFPIRLIDASNLRDHTRNLHPSILAERIECATSAPVTSTTTTTLPECIDSACPSGERCFAGSCGKPNRYEVEVYLESETTFGALQFDLDYDCRLGSIVGTRNMTQCTPNPELNAYASFNDRLFEDEGSCPAQPDDQRPFTVAFVAPMGVSGPMHLFTCVFQSYGRVPTVDDFSVTVEDASDTGLAQLWPRPTVGIAAVSEILP